jgi:hypothetical protein
MVEQFSVPSAAICDITKSVEHSPSWEVNSFSASQQIFHILRYPEFHYCLQKSPQLNKVGSGTVKRN